VGAHQYSKYLRVLLNTIEQQRNLIGQEATRMVLEFIRGTEPARPRQILVEPRLISVSRRHRGPLSPSRVLRRNHPRPSAEEQARLVGSGDVCLERFASDCVAGAAARAMDSNDLFALE
jgi:hypothetical protein